MVALGLAMLGLGLWSLVARVARRLYDWPWLHRAAILMGPSGFVAVITGWVMTEVGRLPYIIYGLSLHPYSVSSLYSLLFRASLMPFLTLYFSFFSLWDLFYFN